MAGRGQPRQITANSPQELESKVRERCLNLLAQQPRTRAELERSLPRAGAPDELVGEVLDRFTKVGLVDDTAYAEAYIRTGVGVRRRGTRSLRAELRGRGVAPEVIESATSEVDEATELATATALAQRRSSGLARLEPQARRRRLAGLLLRRGFSGAIVSAVLAEVLRESADSELGGSAQLGRSEQFGGFTEVEGSSGEAAAELGD